MESMIRRNAQARASLAAGAIKAAAFLGPAYGPAGRDALLDLGFHVQRHTKDGSSILKQIRFSDPFEQQGAQLLMHAAERTRQLTGSDGTETVLLAAAMLRAGIQCIEAGFHPILLQKGMKNAADAAAKIIRQHTIPAADEKAVARLAAAAAGSIDTGELILKAVEMAGKDGVILVEENMGNQTELEITRGICFDRGYISPYLANNRHRLCAEFQDAYLLITDFVISDFATVLPLLEAVKSHGRPLLIIAKDVTADALSSLIANSLRGVLQICAVRAPEYGDESCRLLEDIAVYTGGVFISQEKGGRLSDCSMASLGRARRIRVEPDRTMIEEGAGTNTAVENRLQFLYAQLKTESDGFARIRLQRRIAALSKEAVRIKVGAVLQTEALEMKKRCEDALSAVWAAKKEGVVYGAVSAYVHAAGEVRRLFCEEMSGTEELQGVRIVTDAMELPLYTMAENAGQNGTEALAVLRGTAWNFAYDLQTAQPADAETAGIFAPATVLCTALDLAAGTAAAILNCEAAVTKKAAHSDLSVYFSGS